MRQAGIVFDMRAETTCFIEMLKKKGFTIPPRDERETQQILRNNWRIGELRYVGNELFYVASLDQELTKALRNY